MRKCRYHQQANKRSRQFSQWLCKRILSARCASRTLTRPIFCCTLSKYGRSHSRLLHDMPQQRMPASKELPQAVVCNALSCGRSVSPRAQPAALSEWKRRMRALPPDKENPSCMGDKRHAARHSLRSRAEHKTGHGIPFRENPILPILSRGNSAHSRRAIRGSKHFPQ